MRGSEEKRIFVLVVFVPHRACVVLSMDKFGRTGVPVYRGGRDVDGARRGASD